MSEQTDTTALPEAVQKQLEEAEAMMQQMAGQAQAAQPQQEPQEASQPEARQEESPEIWEQRYKTLKGKYDAEIPRLKDELDNMRQYVARVTQELMALKARAEGEGRREEKEPEPHELLQPEKVQLLTDDDKELHGEELIDLAVRAARQVLAEAGLTRTADAVRKLTERVSRLEEQVSTVSQQSGQTQMAVVYEELRRRIDGFDELMQSQQFAEWLAQPDPLSGVQRSTLADAAVAQGDIQRAVAIVEAFIRETGWRPSQGRQEQQTQQAPSPQVEQYVEPEPVAPTVSAEDAASRKKIWTVEEYQRVYDPRFEKKVGEEEAARLRALADQAVKEGRIRWH